MTTLSYIPWQNAYHFTQKIQLGSDGLFYNFAADYNTADGNWYITIYTYDNTLIISYKKLVLQEDLFDYCYSDLKPNCKLIALSDSEFVTSINDEVMFAGDVRLYHVI